MGPYTVRPFKLENLNIYDGINTEKNSLNKNLVQYTPKLKFKKNEIYNKKFKPGFLTQMQEFKNFINGKKNITNNLIFAKKIMILAKKISI